MKQFLVKFLKDESGATAIEYGLIAAALMLLFIMAMPWLEKFLNVGK